MSEPRFERNQLGEVLRRAAELQEGRAAPDAADRLGLLGLKQMAEEAGPDSSQGSGSSVKPAGWWKRILTRLKARVSGK